MKKKSLKRSSNEYVEIENFKDYELTNNIAYEMAIRNEEVKALIEEYDSLDEANKYETKEELLELIINDKFMPPRQREIDYILREDFFITSQRRFNDPDFSKTILYPSLNAKSPKCKTASFSLTVSFHSSIIYSSKSLNPSI